jgi:hypothetical protein
MATRHGRCLCGAVRFAVEHVETGHHACHCSLCRRWASGPVFGAAAAGISFEGTESIGRYDSSAWAQRGFCTVCGSNLFYLLKATGQYFLSVGTFEDASDFTLAREIFVDHKPQGYAFAGEHETLTEAQVFAAFAPP